MPGQPFGVVIDYAHSPASLEKVLELLAPVAAARGGGADRGLRLGGGAGHREAADDGPDRRRALPPRRRRPTRTRAARTARRSSTRSRAARRTAGKRRGRDLLLIADRPAAIAAAFERARPGDIVLLAGKGHEQSIIGPDGPGRRTTSGRRRLAALAALGYAEAAPGG